MSWVEFSVLGWPGHQSHIGAAAFDQAQAPGALHFSVYTPVNWNTSPPPPNTVKRRKTRKTNRNIFCLFYVNSVSFVLCRYFTTYWICVLVCFFSVNTRKVVFGVSVVLSQNQRKPNIRNVPAKTKLETGERWKITFLFEDLELSVVWDWMLKQHYVTFF